MATSQAERRAPRETIPHPGSFNDRTSRLSVNEDLYVELAHVDDRSAMRKITAKSRFPTSMQGMEFSGELFTAVAAAKFGNVRHLICIRRVA